MSHHILIIGPAWIGDTVMSQSLFKLLKQRDPTVTIDVLAPEWTFSLLSCMPEVRQTISMPLTHGEVNLRARYQLAKSLRAGGYDQAIVLPNSFKSALVPWLANIPKRTGWLGECRYLLLNDSRRLDKKRYPLMVEQYAALALAANEPLPTPVPYPEFQVTAQAQEAVLAKFQPARNGRPVLAMSPGAAFGPSKCWPPEYFAEVARCKIDEGWDVWLFGSKGDQPIIDTIQAITDHRCESFAGRTELAETIALLSLTSGVVTNDSGLMHMAAALRKPLVALYGSTSPAFTPPLADNAQILQLALDCQPCFQRVCPLGHHRCMRDLNPQRVLAAIAGWS